MENKRDLFMKSFERRFFHSTVFLIVIIMILVTAYAAGVKVSGGAKKVYTLKRDKT